MKSVSFENFKKGGEEIY